MSKFEVIRGVEGCCITLDDTRIAGPKPWGGGTVIHAWKTDKTYKAVDEHNRWHQLFGTPENAARTIHNKHLTYDVLDKCDDCPYVSDECYESYGVCAMQKYDTLLEWLEGGAE